eukprot:8079347-Pyramimonas_sp.AAC.1
MRYTHSAVTASPAVHMSGSMCAVGTCLNEQTESHSSTRPLPESYQVVLVGALRTAQQHLPWTSSTEDQ